jgi:type I restriction enzyme S subunit
MSELPTSWSEVQIGTFARVVGGGTPPSKDPANFAEPGKGIPWLTPADLSGYRAQTIERGMRDLTTAGFAACGAVKLPKGAVLFSSRAPIGYVAIAAHEISTNQGFKSFVLPDGFDPRFCYYQLKHLKPVAEAIATGTTFKELSGAAAATLPFKVAPLDEQTLIADQLDTLLARVNACNDHLDAIPGILKRFRQAVLSAAMTGALTDELRSQAPSGFTPAGVQAARLRADAGRNKKSVEEFVSNNHPVPAGCGLPDGWLRTHVGMVGAVSNGSTPSRRELAYWGGDIPWVSSGEVANKAITCTREQITDAGFKNTSVRLLPAGTVLMAMIGEGKTRGQSALLEIAACINQNIAGVIPVAELIESKYLWYWFQRQYETTRASGNGSGPKALNCERVREQEVLLPSLMEQLAIVQQIEKLFAMADRIEARYTTLRTHAQRLAPQVLAKAFRGELVPQDLSDEPASALLARIATQRAAITTEPKTRKPRQARGTPAPKEAAAMTKSRQDDDVKGKPYLASHLRRLGAPATAEVLFKESELPVADFYKQLAWEVAQGHVTGNQTSLEAGHAAG